MDDLQVQGILTDTEAGGGRLAGFYHSHIDCDAYFSEEDRTAALFMDEPTYPGVVHIVVSIVEGEVRGWRGFLWDDGEREFVEVSIVSGG
jgi:proteasome lid subunit RPN8/RPN11